VACGAAHTRPMLASTDAASLLLLRLLVCVERVVVVGGRARVMVVLYVEVELGVCAREVYR